MFNGALHLDIDLMDPLPGQNQMLIPKQLSYPNGGNNLEKVPIVSAARVKSDWGEK
jgi:hypothetical protein